MEKQAEEKKMEKRVKDRMVEKDLGGGRKVEIKI